MNVRGCVTVVKVVPEWTKSHELGPETAIAACGDAYNGAI